jgi:ADP-ribose pyrophosphatase YjhB (NUDIX family)
MNNTNKEFDIHPIQASILCELLFLKEGSFGQLSKLELTSDLLSFHVKQLINWGLVDKSDKKYVLTQKGKEFANRFDTDKKEVEKQPKVGVLVIGIKKEKGVKKYLVQQRLKQPYYGYWGFTTGKVRWGETVLETAAREFVEETGLTGEFILVGIRHKMDYKSGTELLEDKFFLVVKAEKTKGELKENFEGGRNVWMTKEDILKLPDLFPDIERSFDMAESKNLKFVEMKVIVERY